MAACWINCSIPSTEEARDLTAGEFDFSLESITGQQQRQALCAAMMEHLCDSKRQPAGFQSKDLIGSVASVVVPVLAVVPSLIPLVLLRE